jgi:hypothetical protein
MIKPAVRTWPAGFSFSEIRTVAAGRTNLFDARDARRPQSALPSEPVLIREASWFETPRKSRGSSAVRF